MAFAGPTYTDFDGAPGFLDPARATDRILLAAGIAEVAKLRPGSFPRSDEITLRALLRLATLLEGAPDLAVARPEPTARLLAHLQDALNGGDLNEAWRIHALLREESRLEALNLVQLEVQILAASGEWDAIRCHDRFESLVLAGPSAATAEALLEAIYWTAAYDGAEQRERTREVILADPAIETARLLLAVAPQPAKPVVERLREFLSPTEINVHLSLNHELVEFEKSLNPVEQARAAFSMVASLPAEGNADADASLLAAMATLSPEAQDDLLRRPMHRAIWKEVLERSGEHAPPSNWSEWVDALGREGFEAAAAAAHGATAWRLPDRDIDPANARDLAAQVEAIPAGLPEERFGAAIPYLVQWAQSDPRWPRQDFCSVYLAILTRMAVSSRRGETALRSASGLLWGVLHCGLSSAEYRDALDAAETVCVQGLSRTSAYDALEVLEIARSVAPADEAKLRSLCVNVISVLANLSGRLTECQRLALNALASEVGMVLGPAQPPIGNTASTGQILAGRNLGIYTLTEAAGRQAAALLRSTIPGLIVDLNHDHGGSAALAAMAARADLVVVAWASAKHAATEFIKARRGARPLVYAAGKGATSLVRAVEDWLTSQARHQGT